MDVRYICSLKMLIIVSPGWSLKFTETSGLHSLCTKTFGSITCKKLLSHILPAASEHAQNNPFYSLVKGELADLLITGALSSLIFPQLHSKTLKITSFLWSSAVAVYLLTAMMLHSQPALWLKTARLLIWKCIYDNIVLEHGVNKKTFHFVFKQKDKTTWSSEIGACSQAVRGVAIRRCCLE